MMLGDPQEHSSDAGGTATLDELFRAALERNPHALALCDPPNRQSFTDGDPRTLTYAEADCVIGAIAGRLRRLGLAADSVVALQLPNTVESVLALLGVLRAGLIAAPLPLLWRQADAAAALNRAGAKAIVTTSRIGGTDHGQVAMKIAAEVFPVRYVCSFGKDLSDGVIPLDEMLAPGPNLEGGSAPVRDGNPAAHVAVVGFELTPSGLIAVARSHGELIAGGRAAIQDCGLADGTSLLACYTTSSFAGLAAGLISWLLTGGTLSLHHAFDADTFAQQCRDRDCGSVAVPGALATRLAQAGLLGHPGLRSVVALWRAPERTAIAPTWPHPHIRLIDVRAFGETAIVCTGRNVSGDPAAIPLGAFPPVHGPGNGGFAETAVTPSGTLAIRGAMVPRHAFPPGAERSAHPCFAADPAGFVDTHFPCRINRESATVEITGPPPDIVSVGGYRFRQQDLHGLAGTMGDAVLTALPDALAGHRLAGHTADPTAALRAFGASGVNPLIAGAFEPRRKPDAA